MHSVIRFYSVFVFFIMATMIDKIFCVDCGRKHRLVDSADISTLQFAQVVFRHGDRTPLDPYPNDPYKYPEYWKEGEGQLTKKGKEMGYALGKYLRWRYDGYLDHVYSIQEVYVQSSDFDRTIMTALTCLAGLFPTHIGQEESDWNSDVNWQPIPVHSIPNSMDHKLAFFIEQCPRYRDLLYEIGNSSLLQKINAENSHLYEYLKQNTGLPVVDFKMVGLLYDILLVQKFNNLELPSWTKSVFPEQMEPLYVQPFHFISYTREMRRLRGGPLLSEMVYNMEQTILLKSSPTVVKPGPITKEDKGAMKTGRISKSFKKAKVYMYSGHDTSISALLATIGVYDFAHVPPYTSMVMLELHYDAVHGYFVRLFYRNETNGKPPIEYNIPNCIDDCSNQNQVCTFTRFKQLMQPSLIKPSEWVMECNGNNGGPSIIRSTNSNTNTNQQQPSTFSVTPSKSKVLISGEDINSIYQTAISASEIHQIAESGLVVSQELYDLFIKPFVNFYFWVRNQLQP